ncbi:hypothetical protein TNCT_31481 [Trichonephila clavata]|uniref:Uncharacterized protein n=1 Tax=Trichonephila clavata TaxID=2740835 RepID=A0A8X6LVV3_TRICU|nr:hypothetical protein TNCT_31481 [Trichonephila clavata]
MRFSPTFSNSHPFLQRGHNSPPCSLIASPGYFPTFFGGAIGATPLSHRVGMRVRTPFTSVIGTRCPRRKLQGLGGSNVGWTGKSP